MKISQISQPSASSSRGISDEWTNKCWSSVFCFSSHIYLISSSLWKHFVIFMKYMLFIWKLFSGCAECENKFYAEMCFSWKIYSWTDANMNNSFNSFADALCQVVVVVSTKSLVEVEWWRRQWSQMLSYIRDKLFIVSFCYDVFFALCKVGKNNIWSERLAEWEQWQQQHCDCLMFNLCHAKSSQFFTTHNKSVFKVWEGEKKRISHKPSTYP